jgi:hypothetical protein
VGLLQCLRRQNWKTSVVGAVERARANQGAVKFMTKLKLALKLFLIGLDQFIKFWGPFREHSFALFKSRSSAKETAYMPAVEVFCLAEREPQR